MFEANVGIDGVESPSVFLQVEGRQVTLIGAENREVSIFDLMGRRVYHSSAHDGEAILLPSSGVYMVRIDGGNAQRVVVY